MYEVSAIALCPWRGMIRCLFTFSSYSPPPECMSWNSKCSKRRTNRQVCEQKICVSWLLRTLQAANVAWSVILEICLNWIWFAAHDTTLDSWLCAVRLTVRCWDLTWSFTDSYAGCRKILSTQEVTSSVKRLLRQYVFMEVRRSRYTTALSGSWDEIKRRGDEKYT